MPYPRRKFPAEKGLSDPRAVLEPVGIFSGMTKRNAMCDGAHVQVENAPRGNTNIGQKRKK